MSTPSEVESLVVGDVLAAAQEINERHPELENTKEGDLFNGRYRIDTVKNRGRCALAAYAHDTENDQSVFVKAVNIANDEDFVRFYREVQTVEDLEHPQIPEIYANGQIDDSFGYSIFEPKPDASNRDDWGSRTSQARFAASVCVSALEPIGYLHENGLVHCDVKPGNLVISSSGAVALTDFEGVRRLWSRNPREQNSTVTVATGDYDQSTIAGIFGTPGYVSPEQALGRSVNQRADVYAMGATLFRFLYGYNPIAELREQFRGNPQKETAYAFDQHRFLPRIFKVENTRGRNIPDPLAAIIEKATQKIPDYRYESAAEMQEALEAYLYDSHPA